MSLKNAQYNAIMRQYDRLQANAQHVLTKKIEEIEKNIPEFSVISDEISKVAADHTRLLLSGHPVSKADLHQKIQQLEHKKLLLLEKNGYPIDYLLPDYACKDCKDTGYIDNEKCHCFKQAIVDYVYAQSNIQEKLKEENFEHFDFSYYSDIKDDNYGFSPRENIQAVLKVCTDFIQNFDQEFSNLLFYGHTGVGKTFLSNCIAKNLLDSAHTVIYLSAPQLIQILEKYIFEKNRDDYYEQEDMYSYILDCDLLIIDDLGTEMANSFTTSQLFSCLNERLLRKHSTIISTNYKPEELLEHYSERIFSRLISAYKVLLLTGEDIRIKKSFS